ncbi:MAG: glycosyltransferase [Planctomycetes bacterium]|nr:glycosyltransferase [Planctomycetota bacterium]
MRILILAASAGAGHLRAAQALEAASRESRPDVGVMNVDALDRTPKLFKKWYAQSYLQAVNHIPKVWGYFYEAYDRKTQSSRTAKVMRLLDRFNAAGLYSLVDEFKPDRILTTHFLPSNVLLSSKRKERAFLPPVSVCVTDYDIHFFWIHPDVTRWYVGSEEVKWQVHRKGVPLDRIVVAGIPIHPVFSKERTRLAAAAAAGLDPAMPTVLVLSGGFGVGHIAETVEAVLKAQGDFQVAVVCGRNEDLKKQLGQLKAPQGKRLEVRGFVTDMENYLTAADFVVTKPGGLSVSEAIARGCPIVAYAPIPGQEERNCDYLMESGAAVKAKDPATLEYKIRLLLTDEGVRRRMAEAARRIARPRAAYDIVGLEAGSGVEQALAGRVATRRAP